MSVTKKECDICGDGSPSDGVRLCERCEALEREFDGDLGRVGAVVGPRNRRKTTAMLADELRRRDGAPVVSQTWADLYEDARGSRGRVDGRRLVAPAAPVSALEWQKRGLLLAPPDPRVIFPRYVVKKWVVNGWSKEIGHTVVVAITASRTAPSVAWVYQALLTGPERATPAELRAWLVEGVEVAGFVPPADPGERVDVQYRTGSPHAAAVLPPGVNAAAFAQVTPGSSAILDIDKVDGWPLNPSDKGWDPR